MLSMDLLLDAVVIGVLLGCFYAAVSIGLSVSFGLLDVPHVAHPAFLVMASYAVYVLAVVGIPIIGTKDWQGTGRYLLAAFPVFAALAGWLLDDRVLLRRVLVTGSGLLLVFLTSAFARGYYLA